MVRILELEEYAAKNNIPIMMKDGIEFLLDFIKDNEVTSILEIGSAIGYSAIRMALLNKNIRVTTIERDLERYNEAVKNIHDFNLEEQITIINDDAFNVELNQKFDLIFIDAAKSQYIKFFEKFKANLNCNGYIVSDNLNFHGLTKVDLKDLSRNVRGLVRKLNSYIEFLETNTEFSTTFYEIGDGVSVSKRKEDEMKKNAFTLIELLGVIVILAAVMLIAFPPILNQIQKSQGGVDEATKTIIINAAKLFVDQNDDEFKTVNGNIYCKSFDDLITSGLLTKGMISGSEDALDDKLIKISYNNGYVYEIVNTADCTSNTN
ncbi:MAG: prepilin-type N-terminal cleavage/methylation domain-containing protein [Firmicutes bacterium]|nr:prepilin-type N-terminal cleavage/methylation domain-containing protein [Bacillota bacterium]